MKVLWISNIPVGALSQRLTGKRTNGLWLEALLSEFKKSSDHNVVFATAYKVKKTVKVIDDNVTYYALPDNYPPLYNANKKKNLAAWKEVIDSEKPDIIHVFGTEFPHGLCALKVKGDIPAVIHMQGVMSSIARFYLAGIPYKEIKKTITFRDIIKKDGILSQQKKFYRAAKHGREMISIAKNVITENDWCDSYVKAAYPEVKIYKRAESLNEIFKSAKWDIEKAEKHSIMCTASGYTIKGLHIMLRALAMLKASYPDVKLYVPGTPQVSGKSLKSKIKRSGYTKYIEKLIKELNVKDNVVWTGEIKQSELLNYYLKVRAFVLCSAIENHSNSLKEAMTVGVPSVASAVGGVTYYAKDGENALLYRFEEYEVLADKLNKLFTDDSLCEKLSVSGREKMISMHDGKEIFSKTVEIYNDIINSYKKQVN